MLASDHMPFREGWLLALPDWPNLTNQDRQRIVKERWRTDLEAAEWASQLTVADYDQTRVDPEARLRHRYLDLFPMEWRYRVDRPEVVAFVGWHTQRSSRRNSASVVFNVGIVSIYDRATGDAVGTVAFTLTDPDGTIDEVADIAWQFAATATRRGQSR